MITENDKKRIEEEEAYRNELCKRTQEETEFREGINTSSAVKGKGVNTVNLRKLISNKVVLVILAIVGIQLLALMAIKLNLFKHSELSSIKPLPSLAVITPTPELKQLVNSKAFINKKYADMESILGPASMKYSPEGEFVGKLIWEKGGVEIEADYYNLQDKIQDVGFLWDKSATFSDYNDVLKTIGLFSITRSPDYQTRAYREWHNEQNLLAVGVGTSNTGDQWDAEVTFTCSPNLTFCPYDLQHSGVDTNHVQGASTQQNTSQQVNSQAKQDCIDSVTASCESMKQSSKEIDSYTPGSHAEQDRAEKDCSIGIESCNSL